MKRVRRTVLAYLALIPIATAISIVGEALHFGNLAWLGAAVVGMILASFVDPVGFGWREPSDRRR